MLQNTNSDMQGLDELKLPAKSKVADCNNPLSNVHFVGQVWD